MSVPAYEFIHGDKIKTRSEYPYSYDAIRHFTRQVRGKMDSAYDDRIQQWDYGKWRDAATIMNDKHGRWSLSNGAHAEELLRLYYDAPKLVLVDLVEFCNPSSGYGSLPVRVGTRARPECASDARASKVSKAPVRRSCHF